MPNVQLPCYRSAEEIAQLVAAFEAGTLVPEQFNHHAHMTVGLWYLAHMSFAEAMTTMRVNVQHFAARHRQSQLYHETITGFWMRLLRHILDTAAPTESLAEVVYRAITTMGTMEFFFKHYGKERAFSVEARQHWVEPDILPLPFRDPSN